MPGAELSANRLLKLRAGIDLETLRRMGPFGSGMPRSQVTVPISPDGHIDDTVLFQDPADAAKSYYLPRYRLRVTPATGRYEITTTLVDGLWRMTFGLESFPAPEITRADAAILQHELSVSVSSAGQLARDYPVAEFTPGLGDTQNRPEVVLLLTLPERDALLRAFTRDDEQAKLVVHRGISVAVLSYRPRPRPDVVVMLQPDRLDTHVILPDLVVNRGPNPIPEPIKTFKPVPVVVLDDDGPGPDEVLLGTQLRQKLQVDFREQLQVDRSFERLAFKPAVAAQPLLRQVESRDHRTLRPVDDGPIVRDNRRPRPDVDESQPRPRPLPFPWPRPKPDPDPIVVGDDPDPEPRYVVTRSVQDATIPLRFDVDAHPYLFPSGLPPASKGFATLAKPWPTEGPSSRAHVYFQDQNAGNVFYFLPDAFLIGQREEAPYGPQLSFTVGRTTDENGAEKALALMSVHLVPQTSPARLVAARKALAEHVPAGGGAPELRPAVHPATCRLELPGVAITTSAPPDLVRGWWVAESFAFDALRDVYAVLSGGAANALRGRVDVQVGDDTHQVPVELRLDRPATPPLSWTEKPGTDGAYLVTLRNEGDVDLTVPELPAWLDAGGSQVPATVTGALPATLSPGATLELTVTPRHDPPQAPGAPEAPDQLDVTLDVSGVRVVMVPEKAVEQTLDRRVERLPRPVKLLTTQGGLGRSGDPEKDLAAIGVQFEGVASAVVLDHTTLQVDVAVPVPLRDWLLDLGLGAFHFRQTLVHVSGSSQSDTAWRSTDSNLLALPQP
jgi:hypothetical protein